eukprot:1151234-Pelagomonas_calceolata.AAC.9
MLPRVAAAEQPCPLTGPSIESATVAQEGFRSVKHTRGAHQSMHRLFHLCGFNETSKQGPRVLLAEARAALPLLQRTVFQGQPLP